MAPDNPTIAADQRISATIARCLRQALPAILLALLSATAVAQAVDESATVAEGQLGAAIVEWTRGAESAGFTGAILAAKEGKVVAAVGVGPADLDGKRPNTPATLFELASASKPFTAIAVVQLAAQKKLGLDDSIADHLPGVPDDCRSITVRHLLEHTSGIPRTNSQGRGDRLEEVLPQFLQGGPRYEPGKHYEYWNQGYALLSEIIARASKQDFRACLVKQIFRPAAMKSTRFTGQKALGRTSVAIGRSSRGEPRSALDHPYGDFGLQYRGMGGVVTNVWDLWRWDRALAGDKLLADATKRAMFTPGPSGYALGWHVRKNPQGRLVQSHGGSVRGFVCEIRRYPEEDGCLFVLCNSDDAPVGTVANGVEAILFGDVAGAPPMAATSQPIDQQQAAALAGMYKDERGREFLVELEGAVAKASINWSPPGGPISYGTIGKTADGGYTLNSAGESYPLVVEQQGNQPASSITLLESKFARSP